eukprot:CAMPEP_0206450730 /NCGR_PEP_ID=MMETSP0324_2-20121206/18902_1 /ASSEMBLY_ACC=CAM_ASM_000836 /TAXON_ID=2866 /ORGANISM="Crypthecodinium cohnii, Strain Seligo" /LENGTH=289 /DNA_ID=CAMNT_0053920441 /DNA_START=128 /DNA_END=995 /DNA_ORIENTATION=-
MNYVIAVPLNTSNPQSTLTTGRKLGWLKDPADPRDKVLKFAAAQYSATPSSVDLRSQENLEIYDQGSLGSCTAQAIGAAFHFCKVKVNQASFRPSRLFIYYNERVDMGTVNQDSGAYIRTGVKLCNKQGVCPESMWPHDTSKWAAAPPAACYTEAMDHQTIEYASVNQTLQDLKVALASGFPVVFGFVVYSSFMTQAVANTGKVPMPTPWDSNNGGHAVMAVGYDDAQKVFIVRNSWGSSWGDKGYFYMPYNYLTSASLAQDFWVIRSVEDGDFPGEIEHRGDIPAAAK